MTHNEKIVLARKWVSEYSMQNYFGDITQILRESIISCIVDAIKDYEQTIKQDWNKPTEKQPPDLKPVVAYIRYFSMPENEFMWHEEKKIKKCGYAFIYIEKDVWWDCRATINSKPLQIENIIGWMELPIPPSEDDFK